MRVHDHLYVVIVMIVMHLLLITGAPPVDTPGPPIEPVMPVPPMDGTADHPDHYIPEPVRHFLPYFYKQVMEKVWYERSVEQAVCTNT